MRKTIYNIIMCVSLLTIAGCSSDADSPWGNGPVDKQPIELSVGVDNPTTRAVVTDGDGKTLQAFNAATDLWMVMKSEFVALSGDASNLSDLDYKGAKTPKYCYTKGTTGAKINENKENEVSFTDGFIRYWDDAHARSSKLSVWALAVPGVTTENFGLSASAFEAPVPASFPAGISWTIPTAQTAETVKNKDLCFSNNVVGENVMKFDASANPKTFDKGKLIFYHALTKITVKLVEGEGFDHTSMDDFNFDSGNVTLKGFNVDGTFDVAEGEFDDESFTSGTITSMACGTKTATGYTLEALVMPGTDLNSTTLADAVAFSIDGSAFEVSAATLKQKLIDGGDTSFDKFEAGKNYVFTFKINKTGIMVLTATVAEWDDVTAETAYPKINISEVYGQPTTTEPDNNFKNNFSFYLSETETPSYSKGSDVTYNASPAANERMYSFNTPLYWPNHQTHYFFRGIYPVVAESGANTTPTAKVTTSAITVANSGYTANTFPSDLMLGYPRKADGSADETCKVHTSPATQGICATEGDIRMNFQYVMSQVEVQLSTSTGDDQVVFNNKTEITILGGYKDGAIKLSDGTVDFTGKTTASYEMTCTGDPYKTFHDAIIPQSLTNLQFRIKVDGGNGTYDYYYATIADVEVTPAGGTKGKITKWEPGKMYIYKLKVTKTGTKITATLKNWETVTSDNNHIWM